MAIPDGLRIDIDGAGVALLTIARPERQNRLDAQDLEALSGTLDALASDSAVRVLILTGEGRHFCAGASADLLEKLTRVSALEIHETIYSRAQGVARRLYAMPKPVIAAISGAAITLGCEFALACDFRLMDETAFFQEAWIKMGLLPPLGGLFLLPRMVGVTRATDMVLSGRQVHAEEAVEIGLANRQVPHADLLLAARALGRGTRCRIVRGVSPGQGSAASRARIHDGSRMVRQRPCPVHADLG